VPGGGFGDFNGCSGAWPGVYVKNGGPCSASDDTENCNIFGGFKYAGSDLAAGGGPVFCADIGSAYPEAVEACKWMFGASGSYSLNPWPAASDRGIGNPFIRKIRSVTCPASMRQRTNCPAFDCSKGECVDPEVLLSQAPNPSAGVDSIRHRAHSVPFEVITILLGVVFLCGFALRHAIGFTAPHGVANSEDQGSLLTSHIVATA
ncbi:unnamed protein product, partial [Polarella glacialis]